MLMPAIAFSWWLMSQPMATSYASRGRAPDSSTQGRAADDANARPRERDDDPPGPTADVPREGVGAAPDDRVEGSDPSGDRVLYRGLITADIARVARSFLDLPMGTERVADVGGQRFVFVLQRHYHPPGFVGAPTGWHKGVTVYALR